MEQKDYLLREIEKFGLLLQAILGSIKGSKESYAIASEHEFREIKEHLFNETGFKMDSILSCRKADFEPTILGFKGMNTANIELLGDTIHEMGRKMEPSPTKKKYMRCAMHLYELCNRMDKTYSLSREDKITEICRWL
jgi:hypothetical protein